MWPRISAAIVLCTVYSFTYTLICLGQKQISDMTRVCCCCFPRDLTVHFFLRRARVSFKSFSPGFLRNLSVWHVCHFSQSSSESWQFSHNGICWQVVRADSEYVWKTVKLVKKKLKREPPYIWNSMLNCKYILRMQRPPLLIKLHVPGWQPEKVESLKINVILSLQRSYGTLPLNSIYLLKIEFAFNVQ